MSQRHNSRAIKTKTYLRAGTLTYSISSQPDENPSQAYKSGPQSLINASSSTVSRRSDRFPDAVYSLRFTGRKEKEKNSDRRESHGKRSGRLGLWCAGGLFKKAAFYPEAWASASRPSVRPKRYCSAYARTDAETERWRVKHFMNT